MFINGPEGHLLGGWNDQIDTHLSRVLVDLEQELATTLERPIAYTIVDSKGGGLPTAERYAAAQREYISVLPRQGDQSLAAFEVEGEWEPVEEDPDHEAINARWKDPKKAQEDPRRLVLMRRLEDVDPTRVYAGCMPQELSAGAIPAHFRQRWPYQERVIRQAVNGANLNANYGYAYQQVPNRTQRRRWEEAQEKVEVAEKNLAQHREALVNLRHKLNSLGQTSDEKRAALEKECEALQSELEQRQVVQKPTRRCERSLQSRFRKLVELQEKFEQRRRRLLQTIQRRWQQRNEWSRELAARQTARDAIDTESLCRERDLEKDQIMLSLQLLLTSLHDWVTKQYLAPPWQKLELKTSTELIYRKSGQVRWGEAEIEVLLDPYRYPEQQQAMEESCRRFNAACVRWRDGRSLRIQVAQPP